MRIVILIGLLILHLLILANLQFTAWPEMFSYPYLLNNGFNLYKDIALPYQPVLVLLLSGIYKIFGMNLLTLQIFTSCIILFSDFLIFLISQKILGEKLLSLVPLALYIAIQPLTSGDMLWFDLATVPFILLAIISLLNDKYFLFGVFLGGAFFIKQQVGVAIALVLIYLLLTKKFSNLFKSALGLLIIALLVSLYVLKTGIINDYIFWTFTVPTVWYPKLPGYSNWPTFPQLIMISIIFLPGIVLTLKNLKTSRMSLKIILLFWIGLFIVAFPRFDYFRFQPALVAYIILVALLLKKANIAILCLPILLAIFILSPDNLGNINLPTRFYGPGELALAKHIEQLSSTPDKIYLLGVPSIEYVLSNRLPPKPWVDNYVWYMEIEGIQDKVLAGFQKEKPKLILWKTPKSGNWYDLGVYQPQKIVEYIMINYEKTGNLNDGIELWTIKKPVLSE